MKQENKYDLLDILEIVEKLKSNIKVYRINTESNKKFNSCTVKLNDDLNKLKEKE